MNGMKKKKTEPEPDPHPHPKKGGSLTTMPKHQKESTDAVSVQETSDYIFISISAVHLLHGSHSKHLARKSFPHSDRYSGI